MILPNVNLERKCNVFSDPSNTEEKLFQKDGKVLILLKIIIEKGELLTGMLDKGTVGNTSGGVIHHIWLDEGIFYKNYNNKVPKWQQNFYLNLRKLSIIGL